MNLKIVMIIFVFCFISINKYSNDFYYVLSIIKQKNIYIVAFLLLFAFVFRFYLKRKNKYIRKISNLTDIEKLSWSDYEKMTAEFFEKQGYRTTIIGGSGGDGGIDVKIEKNGKKFIVQCKHWKSKKVGVPIVREMLGVMIDKNADGVKIVSTSGFTKNAYSFAQDNNIELITGAQLLCFIKNLKSHKNKFL